MRLTRRALALLLVFSLPPRASAATETLTPIATLTEAERALDQGDLETAESILNGLLAHTPTGAEAASAHLGLSRVFELRGDLAAALEQARKAEAAIPDSAATVFAVGRSLARLGASREAVEVLERARKLAPRDPGPPILQALVLRDEGDVEEAAAVLEEIWTAGVRGPEVASQLGSLHLTLDNPTRSLEILNEALIELPNHPTLVLLKGLALGKDVDNRPEAIGHIRRALDLGPPNPGRVWLELAIMLLDDGDHEAALPALEQAKALRPEDPEVYYRLGAAYRMAGDRDGAIGALERFQELRRQADVAGSTSKRLGTELNRAHALADEGRLPEALELLDEILADAPDNARVHTSKAKVLFSMRRAEDALTSIIRARQLDPGRAEHHLLEGVFLLDLGRPAEAETALRHTLDFDPELIEARVALAGSLAKQNRPAEAIEQFEQALALGGDTTAVRLGYSAALEALGRTEEAAEQMAMYKELRASERQAAAKE
jgi:tetratricopeptide (TPR) repeat protein